MTALNSMTGFARASGALQGTTWAWELKSVNGKTLDIRLRLPMGFDQLDLPTRAALARDFKRGSLQVNLSVERKGAGAKLVINKDVLAQYVALAKDLRKKLKGPAPSAESLLAMKGVVEISENAGDDTGAALEKAIMRDLEKAIAALSAARADEGAKLSSVIEGQLAKIESLHAQANANPARQPDAIKAKLKLQVAALMEAGKFDEQRLAQEAVVLATKADVKEELDRLSLHIAAARELLKANEPVGRKFDFLAQEFNREANTLCSKSNDSGLTAIGLELKTVIDQMREQVQNIE